MTSIVGAVTRVAIAGPIATVCVIALICVLALTYIVISDRRYRKSRKP